jgi:hypothetical protein
LLGHDHGETPTGLWFAAAVRRAAAGEPGEWCLDAWFYLLKSEANAEIRRQIDAGVVRYASIGFRHDGVQCDLCGALMARPGGCEHAPGREVDGREATFTYAGDPERVEAHEGSLVYLGAQYGAELVKAVGSGQWPVDGSDNDAAGPTVPSELSTASCRLPPALKALAEDGRAYRAWLRGELARLAGIVRAEAEAGLLLAALEGQPAAKWLPVIAGFQARVAALLPAAPHGMFHRGSAEGAERGERAGTRAAGGRPVRLG